MATNVAAQLELDQASITEYKSAATIISTEIAEPDSPVLEKSDPADSLQSVSANNDVIISSPYTEVHHRLALSSVDTQSALFARALTTMKAAVADYATASYETAFDWDAIISTLRDLCQAEGRAWTRQSFYVVAFYSKLQEEIDRTLLHQLDKESHAEAAEKGGLLKYWFGSPNSERRNLATCKCAAISNDQKWMRMANSLKACGFLRSTQSLEVQVHGTSVLV